MHCLLSRGVVQGGNCLLMLRARAKRWEPCDRRKRAEHLRAALLWGLQAYALAGVCFIGGECLLIAACRVGEPCDRRPIHCLSQ